MRLAHRPARRYLSHEHLLRQPSAQASGEPIATDLFASRPIIRADVEGRRPTLPGQNVRVFALHHPLKTASFRCREKIRIEGHVEVPQRDRNGLGREAMPINGPFNRPSTLRWVCHALANDCDAQYADLGEFDLPWRKRANAPPSTAVSESSALVLFVLASCHSLDLRSLQFAPLIHPARPSRVHPVTCRLLPLREESSRHGSCSLLQDAVADTAITGGVRCAIPSL